MISFASCVNPTPRDPLINTHQKLLYYYWNNNGWLVFPILQVIYLAADRSLVPSLVIEVMLWPLCWRKRPREWKRMLLRKQTDGAKHSYMWERWREGERGREADSGDKNEYWKSSWLYGVVKEQKWAWNSEWVWVRVLACACVSVCVC